MIKLIVGLGNPQQKYLNTLHNIGYLTIDSLLKSLALRFNLISLPGKIKGLTYCAAEDLFILKPQTGMNLSGDPVFRTMKLHGIKPEEVLVVFDDIYIDLYSSRYRTNGSAGGHNGIKSIIEELDATNFARLKIGVGPVPKEVPLIEYVLGPFESQELIGVLTKYNCGLIEQILKGEVLNSCTFTHPGVTIKQQLSEIKENNNEN